jgi:hypothetical protein
MGIWQFLRNEPVILFVLIGTGLFAADAYVNELRKPQIVINTQMQNAIWVQEEALKGSALTMAEKSAAVQNYIDNQMLFEEALRIGLDRDRNVQAMVIRKYKALMSATIVEPGAQELAQFFRDHQADYMNPRLYDIEEYFFPDNSEDYGVAINQTALSAENWLGGKGEPTRFAKLSEQELLMRMGKDISQQLVLAELQQWTGPLKNYRGVYFVRIMATYDAVPKSYQEVEPYLRDAWIRKQQDNIIQSRLSELQSTYHIQLPQE